MLLPAALVSTSAALSWAGVGTITYAQSAASSLLLASGGPIVDIDGVAFVQAGIVLVLYLVLKPLLFTPWLEVRERREAATRGAVTGAADLEDEASRLLAERDSKLAVARDEAAAARTAARKAEETAARERIVAARTEADTALEQAREQIATQSAAARGELEGRVEELSAMITDRILGKA